MRILYKPQRGKPYPLKCAPNEDSGQPAYPRSLIRAFVVRMKKLCITGYPKCAQGRFWSDCANAQAGPNLCWAHVRKVRFLTFRLTRKTYARVWCADLHCIIRLYMRIFPIQYFDLNNLFAVIAQKQLRQTPILISSYFSEKYKAWHFMWIICRATHKMPRLILSEKLKKKKK